MSTASCALACCDSLTPPWQARGSRRQNMLASAIILPKPIVHEHLCRCACPWFAQALPIGLSESIAQLRTNACVARIAEHFSQHACWGIGSRRKLSQLSSLMALVKFVPEVGTAWHQPFNSGLESLVTRCEGEAQELVILKSRECLLQYSTCNGTHRCTECSMCGTSASSSDFRGERKRWRQCHRLAVCH